MRVGKLNVLVCLYVLTLPAIAGVTVSSPSNNSTVRSSVHFCGYCCFAGLLQGRFGDGHIHVPRRSRLYRERH